MELGTFDISNIPISILMSKITFITFQEILSIFHLGTNLGLAIGKYLTKKQIFDTKIEIGIFEILTVKY